jgi:glyoxylase-like metal-dependent hydrolase (beta-lactamase superfamily II)
MPHISLEDNVSDIIGKAQRGLRISDADLAVRAEISPEDLASVKSGEALIPVIRRVARHLRLDPDALEEIATGKWYPEQPLFPHGFAMFNTVFDDMRVNSYVVWDGRSRLAAAFDTGADATGILDLVQTEKLRLESIFLTHTHDDHIADLARLAKETGATVWASEKEPSDQPGAKTFRENAHFHMGSLSIKTLLTWGHSPGQTSYYITGLSFPLAIVGDSLFAGSIGGSATHFADQHRNDTTKILSLRRDTVLACGHGPLTTVGQERKHNPFFAS